MDPISEFKEERRLAIEEMSKDALLKQKSLDWMIHSDRYKYTYNFSWLGRPIIKYPTDIIVLQELIWEIKPDLIIETGIAHGGSIIFSASMLELIGGKGKVVAVDIDIREHNRVEIEKNPMFKRIKLIEGSSTAPEIVEQVEAEVRNKKTILVCLDSNHTHDHVLAELRIYSRFVSVGSYLVLPDTFIEYFPKGYFSNRPWDVGNNPMTALRQFLSENSDFEIDHSRHQKLLITEAFDGYIRRIK